LHLPKFQFLTRVVFISLLTVSKTIRNKWKDAIFKERKKKQGK
jgi:hypothetical protein